MSAKSFGGSTEKTSSAAPASCPESRAADERRLVHEGAARAVHEDRALLHRRELRGADEVLRLRAARRVERDDVGLREQLVQRDGRDAQLGGALRRHVRVEREERDVPRPQARGHARSDLAEADEADRLALQLGPDELRALPFPGFQRSLCLGDPAQEREEEGDRVLRRGDDVPRRSVDDEDAALRGGLHVDVVEPDARPADDAKLLSGGQELAVHLRGRAHDEGVVVADRREKGLAGKVGAHVRAKRPSFERTARPVFESGSAMRTRGARHAVVPDLRRWLPWPPRAPSGRPPRKRRRRRPCGRCARSWASAFRSPSPSSTSCS